MENYQKEIAEIERRTMKRLKVVPSLFLDIENFKEDDPLGILSLLDEKEKEEHYKKLYQYLETIEKKVKNDPELLCHFPIYNTFLNVLGVFFLPEDMFDSKNNFYWKKNIKKVLEKIG